MRRAENLAASDGVELRAVTCEPQSSANQVGLDTYENAKDVGPARHARLDEGENLDGSASAVEKADDGGGVVAVLVLPRHLRVRSRSAGRDGIRSEGNAPSRAG